MLLPRGWEQDREPVRSPMVQPFNIRKPDEMHNCKSCLPLCLGSYPDYLLVINSGRLRSCYTGGYVYQNPIG